MRARRPLWALLGLAAACGTLDTSDRVHDLRLLAMRAEPPEQVLGAARSAGDRDGGADLDGGRPHRDGGLDLCSLLGLLDGGLPPGFDAGLPPDFDAGCAGPADGGVLSPPPGAVAPVTVTGLIADPLGAGRSIHYAFASCAAVDGDQRCGPDSASRTVLAEGEVAGGTSAEASVTFTPSTALLAALGAGLTQGSVQLPVQLTVSAGSEHAVGMKLLVFTVPPSGATVAPNANPALDGLLANDQPWAADAPPIFTSALAGGTTGGGLLPGGRGGQGWGGRGGVAVRVLPSDGAAELYPRFINDGTAVTLREALRFSYFTTMGSFSPSSSGNRQNQSVPDGGDAGGPPEDILPDGGLSDGGFQTHWHADSNQGAQDVTFWVVVRDGRGGESWEVRTAKYSP